MARVYSNDLRRKLLEAHEQGQGTLEELAEEFRVNLGFAKKISAALRRTGRMERVEQRHGRINRVTPLVQEWLRGVLRQMKLRLKKSRPMPRSKTHRKTTSVAKRGGRR